MNLDEERCMGIGIKWDKNELSYKILQKNVHDFNSPSFGCGPGFESDEPSQNIS